MTTALPTGARALLIALVTPGPAGRIGIPTLLWGRPGVGKSSFIESLAEPDRANGLTVTTLIASIHDPTDFSGLPILDGELVRYAVPDWVGSFAEGRPGILFLDELSTAPPSVQAALLRVVFERRVGAHQLPDSVRIVAAANPPDLMVGGWELSPPLRNRFVHLDWDIPASLYIEAMTSGFSTASLPHIDVAAHAARLPKWQLRVAAFLRISPSLLNASAEENRFGFASPRSWEFASLLLASCDLLDLAPGLGRSGDTVVFDLMKGCLGEGTALTFVEFLRNLKLPDPQDVLAGRETLDLAQLDDSEVYILFGGFNRVVEETEASARAAYVSRYVEYAKQIFDGGRRDLIFVSLKQLATSGTLFTARASAQAAGDTATVSAIDELFTDAGLNDFIDVLG